MLKNDKINLVFALIAAICLWAYVLGDDNSSYTETLKNVPISYINTQALEADGLVVLETSAEAVNIKYTGQRTMTKKVKAADFKVTADVEGLKEGENTVKLTVESPADVEIDSLSFQKVRVTVDKLVEEVKPVSVLITNQTSDESEPYIVQVSRERVKVKGAETLVNKIVSLNAYVDAEKVGNTMKSLSIELIPVDINGAQVEGVKLEYTNVSVTTILHNKKTVNLIVPIIGNQHQYITRDISVPKTITIKGTDELLAQVISITCKSVDVSDIFEDSVIDLEPMLPEGIEIATDSSNLQMRITVIGAKTREFTFTENDVVFEGVTEEMIPVLEDLTVVVTVSGNANVVDQVTESDFKLYADVSGLEKGEHTVELRCVCANNALELEYNPSEIKIVIE